MYRVTKVPSECGRLVLWPPAASQLFTNVSEEPVVSTGKEGRYGITENAGYSGTLATSRRNGEGNNRNYHRRKNFKFDTETICVSYLGVRGDPLVPEPDHLIVHKKFRSSVTMSPDAHMAWLSVDKGSHLSVQAFEAPDRYTRWRGQMCGTSTQYASLVRTFKLQLTKDTIRALWQLFIPIPETQLEKTS